nr:uncharacterized protein LOC123745588 isoform X1 [Procambarus clarkii]
MTHTVLPPVDDTVKERADVHPLCVYQHGVVEFGHHSVRGVIISFYGLQHPKGSSVIIISISIISSCSSSITRRVSVDGGVAVGHQPALQPGELARSTNRLKTLAHADDWWRCYDSHHSSHETNTVEIHMLLNLLCNPFLDTAPQYCCSYVA